MEDFLLNWKRLCGEEAQDLKLRKSIFEISGSLAQLVRGRFYLVLPRYEHEYVMPLRSSLVDLKDGGQSGELPVVLALTGVAHVDGELPP